MKEDPAHLHWRWRTLRTGAAANAAAAAMVVVATAMVAAADKMEGKPRAKFPLHEFVIAKTFFPFVSSIGMQKSSNRHRVETPA